MNLGISEAVSEDQCNCHRMKRTPGYQGSFPLFDVGAIYDIRVVSGLEGITICYLEVHILFYSLFLRSLVRCILLFLPACCGQAEVHSLGRLTKEG